MIYHILYLVAIYLALINCLENSILRIQKISAIEPSKDVEDLEREAIISVIESKKAEAKDKLDDMKAAKSKEDESDLNIDDLPPEEAHIASNIVIAKELETENIEEATIQSDIANSISIANETSKVGHKLPESKEKHDELILSIVEAEGAKAMAKDSSKLNGTAAEKIQNIKRVKPPVSDNSNDLPSN